MKSPNGPVLRPYIKLHLYPFKAAKKKTQPIEAGTDLNPVFDNHFQFKVSFNVCARPVKVASDFGPFVWYFRSNSRGEFFSGYFHCSKCCDLKFQQA